MANKNQLQVLLSLVDKLEHELSMAGVPSGMWTDEERAVVTAVREELTKNEPEGLTLEEQNWLFHTASYLSYEAGYLGGGGIPRASEDWEKMAQLQTKLGIPNQQSQPGIVNVGPFFRDESEEE